MKLSNYIKDQILNIIIIFFVSICIILLLYLLDVNYLFIVSIMIIMNLGFLFIFFHEYLRKREFYNNFNKILNSLDKKYLITEIINDSSFIEGKLLIEYLYEINKSFIDDMNKYKYSNEEFKEYIELWCHEIKNPIAISELIILNNKNKITNNIGEEIDKINSFVEQVLFYARSENIEKDYIISNISLKKIVENVIKKNKKSILEKKIKIELNNFYNVYSDSKWLEFVVNQIIINCIKYSKNKNSIITIDCYLNKNNVILNITDNGIGIKSNEITKIFDKGFTGSNGRKKYNSTGIGLYLVKKMCIKLGHSIKVTSLENKFTTVSITFPNNSLIENIK